MIKRLLPFFLIFGLVIIFFWQVFLKGLLPIPSDTIVGLYYPFREAYFKTNPNGLPYKNFLITDPVRQQYPWKNIVVSAEKNLGIPLWNPYNFAGTPLLANFQSSPFYPVNIIFFFLPFSASWSILVFSQPLLAGLFLFLYLDNLKIDRKASLFGAITFSFSGFFVAWLEWGTILATALWIPLVLLSTDKIFNKKGVKESYKWCLVFVLSLTSSFFAGHLQTFFYLFVFTLLYISAKILAHKNKIKNLSIVLSLILIFFILTFFQWLPTIKFILLSGRNLDVSGWNTSGWFIPWQNLIQFVAPDFFGNPATLNYYGVWNYAEFIGYIGIIPLIMAFFALFFRKDKKTLLFGTSFFLSLLFALPTIFAKIPFKLDLPFLSSSQPTRLLFITDFSLSVLAALGLDYFISVKNKKTIFYVLSLVSLIYIFLWSFVLFFHSSLLSADNLRTAQQNLILPTSLFALTSIGFLLIAFYSNKNKFNHNALNVLIYSLILITIVDLFRFGWKFEAFTKLEYLFPQSSVTAFLQNQKGLFRVMSTDSKILPPNFSVMYKIQTLDGYDPLYLQRYAEFTAAVGRSRPDINPPFGFNRIITPQNPLSRATDFLNVKYVLSLQDLKSSKLKQVFSDGYVKIYENSNVFPRAFFVNSTLIADTKQQAINALFDVNFPLNKRAVLEDVTDRNLFQSNWDIGKIDLVKYQDDKIILNTQSPGKGFLVLTDSYYPTWHAKIDGEETRIYLTDYSFRGIIVPKGNHVIEFYSSLF